VNQDGAQRADFGGYMNWHIRQRYATKGVARRA
jgi:hypothetical protein